MTANDDYFELKRKCIAHAIRRGFEEESEDFASFVLERYSKGDVDPHLKNSFIDFLRITFGDARTRKGNSRNGFLFESIDDHFDIAKETVETFLNPSLSGRLRAILILSFQWGFTQKEIAHVLGVTEPLINVELKGLNRKKLAYWQTFG
jgi:predicted XRE-type DNA-binding protein